MCSFVFINFFVCFVVSLALLDDWFGNEPPDLLQFVPIDWRVGIDLTRYEIFLHTSRYNWLDLSKVNSENSEYST